MTAAPRPHPEGPITVRKWLHILTLVHTLGILSTCPWVLGQGPDTATSGASGSSSPVREVEPRGFYLRNESGDLVYVPDIPYEQFEQLLREQRNLANPPRPAFTLQAMDISGKVVADHVEAIASFSLEGFQVADIAEGTWFRIPLRFNQAYLYQAPSFAGPGEHFLSFDEEEDGYVCWLQMTAAAMHTVRLPLLIPIDRVGEESRITLHAPSPLASTLTLSVPERSAEGTVQDLNGNGQRPLAFAAGKEDEDKGEFTARGIRGNVSISWHASRATLERADTHLDVFGTIIVTADELLQEVRSDARFVVHGFGAPIEVFQLRLPPGMRLREIPEPGYEVRQLAEDSDTAEKGALVQIRLDRPTLGEIDIRIVAELPSVQEEPAQPLTVARLLDTSVQFVPAQFVFPEAARHRGQIDLVVKGDWSLAWGEDPALPRTEPNGHATNGLTARFRYFDQNHSLRVWLRQQPARITVDPTYDVYVDAQHARLFATLECRTSGSKADSLKLSLPGWTAETVNFADVDNSQPVDMTGQTLIVPIPIEAQATGRFSLQVEARQDLTASVVSSTAPLRIVLPSVAAENPTRAHLIVSPATITLIPADNILLTPRPQNMQALSPLVIPAAMDDTSPGSNGAVGVLTDNAYQGTVFRYRNRGSSDQAIFVGDFKIQPQSISVSVTSTVTLDRLSYGVEQQLAFRVLHEPVDALDLMFPKSRVDSARGRVRILLDDEPLTPVFSAGGSQSWVPVHVRLPQPRLGVVNLRIVHPREPISEMESGDPLSLSIPLVFASTSATPRATVISNSLTVLYQDPLRVTLTRGGWTLVEGESTAGKLVLTTGADSSEATLEVALSSHSLESSTMLEQVWLQSWLAGVERRDRAVFRVRSSEPALQVRLPQTVDAEELTVECAVDQVRVEAQALEAPGHFQVPLPAAANDVPEVHVVELWYRLPRGQNQSDSLVLEPPTVDAVDHVQRSYWQLVLPRHDVLLWSNQSQLADLTWQPWRGWRRTPLRTQKDLERWIGAVGQDPVPPSCRTYLVTSFGPPEKFVARTGSRTAILLTASGVALGLGLLLIYFPAVRHPAVLLGGGIVLLACAFIASELSLLAAQAASAGIVLALITRFLRGVLLRPQRVTSTVYGRTPFSDSKSDLRLPRSDGSSKIQTASAPTATPASSAESKP